MGGKRNRERKREKESEESKKSTSGKQSCCILWLYSRLARKSLLSINDNNSAQWQGL